MNIKQTMRNLVLGGLLVVFASATSLMPSNLASADCGGVKTAIINCPQTGSKDGGIEQTGLWGVLIFVINLMVAGVGVLAIGGVIYGGILYITSSGNPAQVKKARMVFMNVVIGVLSFGGMFTLLNFIIPGGVFR